MDKSSNSFISTLHRVDGILYPLFVGKDHLEALKTFKRRASDVFIVTYPKSGTHWLMKIVNLVIHNGEDKYLHGTPSREEMIWIEESGKPGFDEVCLDDVSDPRLFVSHTYYKNTAGGPPNTSPAKYIFCARNPKDITVAFYHHFTKRQGTDDKIDFDLTWDELVDHFLRGEVSFGSWWDHVPEWWSHRDEPNVLFLKYEDMKKDLSASVRTIAHFLGYHINEETVQKIAKATTIESMKTNSTLWKEQHFVRKGEVGDWKNYFTQAQSEAMDAAYHKATQGTGLEFDFGHK